MNKIGDRCLLNNTVCQSQCFNGGQCIVINEYETLNKQFICICPKGFYGEKCEFNQTKILVSFDKNIILPFSIRIHFIDVVVNQPPIRRITFKTILFEQTSTIIYWTHQFNLIFIELTERNYYLTYIEKDDQPIKFVETSVHPSNRCLHIDELFNKTVVNYHLIRRIKFYQIPCRKNVSPRLTCFYDDVHLCLCQDFGDQRVANCLKFDHDMQMNCSGTSACEHDGKCFQDDSTCPQSTLCVCPDCFYGPRCQLSTNGYSLSLDAILGYHIKTNVNISRQPIAVLLSLIISILIGLAGIANGILSLITFKEKKSRDVGCGIYLFISSLNTLLIMIIFTFKVWILVFSQMKSITNRSFLSLQCSSIDFILRFCLNMDQCLTACVAIERAYISIKGINFNKEKVRLIAKRIIIGLVLLSIVTSIHDPIYRRLIQEENDEEKRIWCIVEYPSTIHILNLVFTISHIIIPFIINFISALIIIIANTRQQAKLQKQHKYEKILNKQIRQHKNLLVGPSVLIILGIPRLIISFSSGCMKSPTNSWLFLLGYFI